MTPRDRGGKRPASDRGQATVELALITPLLMLLVMGIVQVGLVARDQVLVVHAARAGARAAAVSPDLAAVRRAVAASSSLPVAELQIELRTTADHVTVVVNYDAPTDVPLAGRLVSEVAIGATATFRRE